MTSAHAQTKYNYHFNVSMYCIMQVCSFLVFFQKTFEDWSLSIWKKTWRTEEHTN